MKPTVLFLLIFSISFTSPVLAKERTSRSRKSHKTKQKDFGLDERFKYPAQIPESILQILRNEEVVKQRKQICFQYNKENDIRSWFTASSISLNNKQPDLLVKAEMPCLMGANIGPFWIFHNTGQSYKLILSVSTLYLSVLDTRTNGFRDIETDAATAADAYSDFYKFDGQVYQRRKCTRSPIKAKKVIRIPCS